MSIKSVVSGLRTLGARFNPVLRNAARARCFSSSLHRPNFAGQTLANRQLSILSTQQKEKAAEKDARSRLGRAGWLALGVSAVGLAIAQQKSTASAEVTTKPKDKNGKGHVIAIVGPSSAGKSTIIGALKQFDSNRVEQGADLFGARSMYQFMENEHLRLGVSDEDWRQLNQVLVPREENWHIHDAVAGCAYNFKEGISKEEQARAIRTAERLHQPVEDAAAKLGANLDARMMDEILEHSQQGKSSVFDILDVNKVHQHPLSQNATVETVLVYCPFAELVNRINDRNRKALAGEIGLNEVRAGSYPLMQYASLVREKKPSDPQSEVIDTVTRKSIEESFDANFYVWIEAKKKSATKEEVEDLLKKEKDGSLEAQRVKDREDLVKAFGFAESDSPDKTIQLVPRHKYDLRIDTSDPKLGRTPQERGQMAAKRILKI